MIIVAKSAAKIINSVKFNKFRLSDQLPVKLDTVLTYKNFQILRFLGIVMDGSQDGISDIVISKILSEVVVTLQDK